MQAFQMALASAQLLTFLKIPFQHLNKCRARWPRLASPLSFYNKRTQRGQEIGMEVPPQWRGSSCRKENPCSPRGIPEEVGGSREQGDGEGPPL